MFDNTSLAVGIITVMLIQHTATIDESFLADMFDPVYVRDFDRMA